MTALENPAASPSPDALPLRTRALLLDMDGTLIDSGPVVEHAWNTFLREAGSEATFGHALHGQPARQVLAELLPGLDEDGVAAAHRRIEEIEIAEADSIRTLPGTHRLVEELDAAAEILGRPTWTIVTSCTMPLFSARWAVTGLPHPAHVVTADQVARGKPDPEPFRAGAERLGAPPESTVVVEDSLGGLRAGAAAGSRTIAVTSTTPAAELSPLAEALITSLDDLEVRIDADELLLERRVG